MVTLAEALAQAFEHHRAGRWQHAESIYRQILAQAPDHAETLDRLGALALQTGRPAEAVRLIERAIAIDDSVAEYHMNLGSAYLAMDRGDDAVRAIERALALDPNFVEAHYNLGVALTRQERLAEAADSYRRCLALRPGHPSALNNLGELERQQGQLAEAIAHLDEAATSDPQFAAVRYNRALAWLAQGRLAEGWNEYEWRLRCDEFAAPRFSQPTWDGSPLTGQTLLLHAEQGLGDTLQFIRYLPLVQERCPSTIVEVPRSLVPILEQSGFRGLVAQGTPLPRFDVQLPLLSLGRVFKTTLETIPHRVPYLSAKPDLVDRWRNELASLGGFKVGIVWQGRPSYRADRYRSMALSQFAPLAKVNGVRLLSLQKGPGAEQISAVRDAFQVVDLGSRIDEAAGPFMDSAAIMKCLDLVITSDTAAAHLAGGLAVEVWLALGVGPDWRWLTGRNDSPWYPTMRLFRQRALDDWPWVFQSMASALERMIRSL